jgi:hypothetical protein
VHASGLNQIEIYFSIVQRKVLTPNDFGSLAALEQRLLDFQNHYEALAQPFAWTFTRRDLTNLLDKLGTATEPPLRLTAGLQRCVCRLANRSTRYCGGRRRWDANSPIRGMAER